MVIYCYKNSTIELISTKISNFMVNTIPLDDNDTDLIIKRMAKRCSFWEQSILSTRRKKE